MEKNIASHDLTDMMISQRMQLLSSRFYFKQHFVFLQKAIEALLRGYKYTVKFLKQAKQSVFGSQSKEIGYDGTIAAVYSVSVASVLAFFFWLSLLLDVTP